MNEEEQTDGELIGYEYEVPIPGVSPIVDYYPLTRGEVVSRLASNAFHCTIPSEVEEISNIAEKILADNRGNGVRVQTKSMDVELLPMQDAFVIRVWKTKNWGKCTIGAFLYGCNRVDVSLYKYGEGGEIIKHARERKLEALSFGGIGSLYFDMRIPKADGSIR